MFKKISKATGRDVASVGGAIASIDLASDELPNGTVMAVEGRREFQDQGTGIATRACKRNGIYKSRSRASAGSTQIKGWSDFLLEDLFGT